LTTGPAPITMSAVPTADASLAIDLRDVAKTYKGRVAALKGIEMHVRRGEIFGLLGPNGAGKSTLVKIIMTIVRPTRAAGTVLGRPVGHKPTLARMGYLPENHRFPRYLTGRQVIEFFGALAKVDRPTRKRRAAELIETVGMRGDADRPVASYSKGMAQRIGLAQALVNDPDLILLDEPTDGVDPVGRRDIRDALVRLRAQGKTVFINSHLLSELEMICDRVAILIGGQVAKQGALADLTHAQQRYEIEVAGTNGHHPRLTDILSVTPGAAARGTLPTGHWIEFQGAVTRIGMTDAIDLQPILDRIRAANVVIQRVQLVRPSLEDLFIEAVSNNNGGAAR
jgi:ABC-2 type transport system ATP-binding protein